MNFFNCNVKPISSQFVPITASSALSSSQGRTYAVITLSRFKRVIQLVKVISILVITLIPLISLIGILTVGKHLQRWWNAVKNGERKVKLLHNVHSPFMLPTTMASNPSLYQANQIEKQPSEKSIESLQHQDKVLIEHDCQTNEIEKEDPPLFEPLELYENPSTFSEEQGIISEKQEILDQLVDDIVAKQDLLLSSSNSSMPSSEGLANLSSNAKPPINLAHQQLKSDLIFSLPFQPPSTPKEEMLNTVYAIWQHIDNPIKRATIKDIWAAMFNAEVIKWQAMNSKNVYLLELKKEVTGYHPMLPVGKIVLKQKMMISFSEEEDPKTHQYKQIIHFLDKGVCHRVGISFISKDTGITRILIEDEIQPDHFVCTLEMLGMYHYMSTHEALAHWQKVIYT